MLEMIFPPCPLVSLQEANNCREIIDSAGELLELPVFFDMEDADGYKELHGIPEDITEICRAFIDNLFCHLYFTKTPV